jgi:hypothetical protein
MHARLFLLSIGSALFVAQTGCVTPDAVREFAAVSKEAARRYPPVVRDLNGSCVRRTLAETPLGSLADGREAARAQCTPFVELQKPLLAAGKALTAYLAALADLAKGDRPSSDEDIKSLTGNLQKAGSFGEPQVKAVNGIASFVVRAATTHYQRKQLAEDIKAADADIGVLTDALSDIVQNEYGRLLTGERDALLARYRQAAAGESSKTALLLLEERWADELSRIDERRNSAAAYAKVLTKIRAGHHALAESAGNFEAKDLIPVLKSNAEAIKNSAEDLKDLVL